MIQNKNKRVYIVLDYQCNNNCIFCHVYDRRLKFRPKTTEEIKKDLDCSIERKNNEVHLLGGEITIRRDVFEIVKYAKDIGFKKVAITTNGRMFYYPEFCRKIIDAGLNDVIFSIHGPDAEIHDYLTSTPGSFEQLMRGISNMKNMAANTDVRLNSNTTILKQNYRHLPRIAEMLVSLKLDSSELPYVHPKGKAGMNYLRVVPNLAEVKPFVHKALDIGIENRMRIRTRYVPFCYMQGYELHMSELYEPENVEHIAPEYYESDAYKARRVYASIKSPACRDCRYDAICFGIHRELKNNLEELIPVKGKKVVRREELFDNR